MKSKAILLSFGLLFLQGCLKLDKPESYYLAGQSNSVNCTYKEAQIFDFSGLSINGNFYQESIPLSKVITGSDCADYPNGVKSITLDWVSRTENIVSYAYTDGGSGKQTVIELETESETFQKQSAQTEECLGSAGKLFGDLASSIIDTDKQRFILNYNKKIEAITCIVDESNKTSYLGNWLSECRSYAKTRITINENTIGSSVEYYENVDCSGERLFSIEKNGDYIIYSNNSDTFDDIDITYSNFYINVYQETLATAFNSNSICGISDWSSNSSQSVNGLSCNLSLVTMAPDESFAAATENEFDIFAVDVSEGKLYLGDILDGDKSSEANRPGILDLNNAFLGR